MCFKMFSLLFVGGDGGVVFGSVDLTTGAAAANVDIVFFFI